MAKRITLVTSGHLSSCPRLIKEAKYFLSLGHKVNVICVESIPRLLLKDVELANSLEWEVKMICWNGNGVYNFWNKFLSIFLYYISKLLNKKNSFCFKNTYWLYKEISKLESDIVIAHQFNSFLAVSRLRKNFKFVYDVEDAYAFMDKGSSLVNYNENIKDLEGKFIGKVDVIIYSSPFYKELYESIYSIKVPSIVIYNVFSEFSKHDVHLRFRDRISASKVSIYWFSQTIGLDRGIQEFLTMLDSLDMKGWEVHLRGATTENVKSAILGSVNNAYSKENIFFHQPVSFSDLAVLNKEHDIGLALEHKNSLNKDYCISNKLFDYMSAGLSIIYSNTKGQSYIMSDYKDYFLEYNENDEFKNRLFQILNDKELLNKSKQKSRELSKLYNIEKEQKKYNLLFE